LNLENIGVAPWEYEPNFRQSQPKQLGCKTALATAFGLVAILMFVSGKNTGFEKKFVGESFGRKNLKWAEG